jgi:hypothetical protein
VTYGRSYLVTLGLAFIGVMVFVWNKQGSRFSEWPAWSYFAFFGLPALGVVLIAIGLFANPAQIKKWTDAASRHEASIIIMIVALPVYALMSLFKKLER